MTETTRPGPFRGLIAYALTPADASGRVDTEALARLLAPLAAAPGVAAVGVLGSTGTYAYLSRAERRRAAIAAGEALGDMPFLVGVGALRTDEAVALAGDAAAAGAAGLLLAPVSYTPLTEAELFLHYETVAGATDRPICIYDNPSTTHVRFAPALLGRIAALDRVTGLKFPPPAPGGAGPVLAELRAALPAGTALGCSGDWAAAEALAAGADGWHSVLAGVLPGAAAALAAAVGDGRETTGIEARLASLLALFRTHGSLRVAHAIAEMQGRRVGCLPRPILPLDRGARARLDAALAALGQGAEGSA